MFQCSTCDTTVFTPECPRCGMPSSDSSVDVSDFCGIVVDQKRKRPDPQPPAPYRKRLAQFCECDEADVMLDRPKFSSMPFKIFTSIGPYIGPKPSRVIRYLLHHIRHLVGRPDSGQGNQTTEP